MTTISGQHKFNHKTDNVPLCVDLDGTLIQSDILWESVIQLCKNPLELLRATFALRHGKVALKAHFAEAITINPSALPYRQNLLEYLQQQHAEGRKIILVTATHRTVARSIAEHCAIFSDVMATDASVNLGGEAKRDALVEKFGVKGYDYIGDHDKDLIVFASARHAILADPSNKLLFATERVTVVERVFKNTHSPLKTIFRAARIHQWAKNALMFVPLLTAHKINDANAWLQACLAFLCFGLLASATYLINDLHDLPSDRLHRKKRHRPLASGGLTIPAGLLLATTLLIVSSALAVNFTQPDFILCMSIYLITTLAYSFDLKGRLIVDTLTLAGLYTIRIVAGAFAIGVSLSEWLLIFSLFFFVSLALLKRYIELASATSGKIPGRSYLPSDLDVVMSTGTSSALLSVLVFVLYINSPAVVTLYKQPKVLWLVCPLLIYWNTRIWFLAKRGWVDHDPIVFALQDNRTYIILVMITTLMAVATVGWN
jgi:4-hydroxybenzoate polyprenyltransferase/phosphoserine phosphatase